MVLMLMLPKVAYVDITAVIWKFNWAWMIQGALNLPVPWLVRGVSQGALAPRHVAPPAGEPRYLHMAAGFQENRFQCTSTFTPLFVCFHVSHWPQEVTWLSPQSVWKGQHESVVMRRYNVLGPLMKHYYSLKSCLCIQGI